MAYDVPASRPHEPGRDPFFVSARGTDETELRRYWDALADGGTVKAPLEPSSWALLHGMITDRFGVTWVLDSPSPTQPDRAACADVRRAGTEVAASSSHEASRTPRAVEDAARTGLQHCVAGESSGPMRASTARAPSTVTPRVAATHPEGQCPVRQPRHDATFRRAVRALLLRQDGK